MIENNTEKLEQAWKGTRDWFFKYINSEQNIPYQKNRTSRTRKQFSVNRKDSETALNLLSNSAIPYEAKISYFSTEPYINSDEEQPDSLCPVLTLFMKKEVQKPL